MAEYLRVFCHVGFFLFLAAVRWSGRRKAQRHVNNPVAAFGHGVAGQVGEVVGSHIIVNPAEGVIEAFLGLTRVGHRE